MTEESKPSKVREGYVAAVRREIEHRGIGSARGVGGIGVTSDTTAANEGRLQDNVQYWVRRLELAHDTPPDLEALAEARRAAHEMLTALIDEGGSDKDKEIWQQAYNLTNDELTAWGWPPLVTKA